MKHMDYERVKERTLVNLHSLYLGYALITTLHAAMAGSVCYQCSCMCIWTENEENEEQEQKEIYNNKNTRTTNGKDTKWARTKNGIDNEENRHATLMRLNAKCGTAH